MKMSMIHRRCEKCGDNQVSRRYDRNADRLVYICLGCGYHWRELPLDARKRVLAGR